MHAYYQSYSCMLRTRQTETLEVHHVGSFLGIIYAFKLQYDLV